MQDDDRASQRFDWLAPNATSRKLFKPYVVRKMCIGRGPRVSPGQGVTREAILPPPPPPTPPLLPRLVAARAAAGNRAASRTAATGPSPLFHGGHEGRRPRPVRGRRRP
uniref:Uncharacterized protein n=1 Tax=Oryza sativa subsp. indica TaxID=39946 RepID=A0A679B9H2_ORYSI|nr:hypothetical protein [Oryza sativa Indica Group]BBD82356.1 hypothetical protein [Oryza sativa Indica Group]